ncbi:aldo/keto reductase [Tropicimonas sp. S265A]|uniref:aldo/keto reductase n=1 Tax=Tropicimonas sp. S265A TaxID=3415134 RepID=UPI003C7AA5EC
MKRTLNGRSVGAIGLGCMSFGGIYGDTTEAESHACLDAALKLGVDHWDVAEIYGEGRSEEVIGSYLRATGAEVTLATKAGIYTSPTRHYSNAEGDLRASLEGSLKRLGRDKVELFYLHRRDPETEIEPVIEGLARIMEDGLCDAIGLSEVTPATLRRAQKVHPIAAVQMEYSLWSRPVELGMVRACAEAGATLVAFSPLARGMLAERSPDPDAFHADDFRKSMPRFIGSAFAYNRAAIDGFRAFCADRGWAVPAAALAWLLSRGDHVLPIPGTRSAAHLAEFVQATDITFTKDDLLEIERLLPCGFADGDRYAGAGKNGVESYC